MKTELIEWRKPTLLYVLVVNSFVKFGISSNCERRKRAYEKELAPNPFTVIKKVDFYSRWQAELIEQIVKWRLRKWAVDGRHEWVELHIQPVLDCISQTIQEIEPEFDRHEYIHKRGLERWDFYKQIAHNYFPDN